MKRNSLSPTSQAGTSLVEVLIATALLMAISAVVFDQVRAIVSRARGEERQADVTQEGREFVNRVSRDLHQVGFPNARMYEPTAVAGESDARVAVGLISISATSLWFEGDVDGDGQVDSIRYSLEPEAENAGSCPCVVQRSQVGKVDGSAPTAQPTNYQIQLTGVVNSAGSFPIAGATSRTSGGHTTVLSNDSLYADYKTLQIFTAFDADGNEVTLPLDRTTNPDALATIRTIRTRVVVLSHDRDAVAGFRPVMTLQINDFVSP